MAVVHIPALLRELTGNREEVEIAIPPDQAISVREVLSRLEATYPGVEERLLWEGDLMPGIAIFVDGEQCMMGLSHKVGDDSQIYFIPPVVGG